MIKKKKTGSDKSNLLLGVFVVIILVFLAVALKVKYTARPRIVPHQKFTDTGTKPGWKIFVYPDGRFNFLYPEPWSVNLLSADGETDYDLSLIYTQDGQDYAIKFMRGGRGAPNYDTVIRETKSYGTNTGYKNIYLKDNREVEELITFKDMHLLSPYIGVEAQLPPVKTEDYKRQIDEFLSTFQKVK